MYETSLLIGGKFVPSSDGRTFERINPETSTIASRAPAATADDIDAAISAAASAFPGWSTLGPTERRRRLMRAADHLEQHAAALIDTAVAETGGTHGWIGFNVTLAAEMLREAAALCTQVQGATLPSDLPGALSMTVRTPCGVVVGIAPWNSPVVLAIRAIAAPLACGNTVVLKASEVCPATHGLVGQLLHESGIGAGVVNVVSNAPGDAGPVVERLIAAPAVRRINFTGSTRVGRIVAQLAAAQFKPVLLELGGKAPLIVLDDADVDAAVSATVFGAFMNQGQVCLSTERVLVHEALADAYVAKLTERARSLIARAPSTRDAPLGLLESTRAVARVLALVDDAVSQGATLPLGCHASGATMQPCIVLDVTPDMHLYTQESFGPVVTVERIRDDEEAVRAANASEYGLSAAVFSRDVSRALRIAAQVQSGVCHINGPTLHDEPQLPLGGTKSSGYGRFGGQAAIAEFTELRTITIQPTTRSYPF